MKYHLYFFSNGRVVFIPEEDIDNAIEQGKELLVICNAWSGGYTIAIGANETYDEYYTGVDENGNPNKGYEMYSYEVRDEEFTLEEISKFYKIIVSSGEKIYMETGNQANYYSGGVFIDWDSQETDVADRLSNKNVKLPVNKNEFDKLILKTRKTVDSLLTVRMMCGKKEDKEEKVKALIAYRIIDKDSEKYL